MTDKLEKSKMIIARLLIDQLFTDWESRSKTDIIANMMKLNDRLQLGINPTAILRRMTDNAMLHLTGTRDGEPYYSTKKRDEPIHI